MEIVVSIILPTFNRADVLARAIDSVRQQSFQEWELIIVDDGSTDGTADLVRSYNHERIRYLAQENAGCYVARNTGIRNARGKYIAFLDSDDEWLPYYLELTAGFLQQAGEHFVMTEFWADNGFGERILNDYDMIANRWPAMAKEVGSSSLDLPLGSSDNYLRMYESCEALSNWLPQDSLLQFPQARLYQGRIFEYFRWGHLGWLPATLVSREAVDRVGLFLEDYRTAADYIFLATLAKHYQTHMIAVPAAVKYEYRNDGTSLEEPHLATGINEYRYASKRIDLFRMLFPDTADGELKRIHGLYELYAGRVALRSGNRSSALQHFSIASECGVGNAAIHLTAKIAGWLPSDQLARYLYITLGHILSRLGIRI